MTTRRYPADIEAAVKADRRPHWMGCNQSCPSRDGDEAGQTGEGSMTDTEKMMLRALKAIALEARKGRPNPDRIYQIAVDAVSRATAPLIDRKADK